LLGLITWKVNLLIFCALNAPGEGKKGIEERYLCPKLNKRKKGIEIRSLLPFKQANFYPLVVDFESGMKSKSTLIKESIRSIRSEKGKSYL
jgi:hypothetical protein